MKLMSQRQTLNIFVVKTRENNICYRFKKTYTKVHKKNARG